MKRFAVITLAVLVLLLSVGGGLFAQEHQKDSWYIGFGLGSGMLRFEGDTMKDNFGDVSGEFDYSPVLALNFGAGVILNPTTHVGVDITGIRQESNSDTFDVDSYVWQINNYYVSASYFPWETGFSIKGGAGLSSFYYEIDSSVSKETETWYGYGVLVGAGYDLWLGESFNLGLHVDYSRQLGYFDSDGPDDSDFINVYVSFYWF